MAISNFKLVFYYKGFTITACCSKERVSKIPHTKVNFAIEDIEFNWTFYELKGTDELYSWFQLPAESEPIAQVIAKALKGCS